MGEAGTYDRVEWALEEALVDGSLRPGTPGWQAVALAVTERCLDEQVPLRFAGVLARELVPSPPSEETAISRLEIIRRERLGGWVRGTRTEPLATWRAEIGPSLLEAPDLPADLPVEAALELLRWLLGALVNGVVLTERGYLPMALVRDAIERFGWWPWRAGPRSEADVFELGELRDLATRAGLLAKRGKRMATTRLGVRSMDDSAGLWRTGARAVADGAFERAVAEVAALTLLRPPDVDGALIEALAPMVAGLGWGTRSGPLDRRAVGPPYYAALRAWRLLGCLDEIRPRWANGQKVQSEVTSLTPLGRIAALQLLHEQALRPRTHPLG